MQRMKVMAVAIFALSVCVAANACEPIIPMGMAAGGPAFLLRSLYALIAAVVLKCVLFGVFQRTLSFVFAFVLMFVGNLVSTVVGAFAGAMVATPIAILVLAPIVFFLSYFPARRLRYIFPRLTMSAWSVAALLVIALFVSLVLFVVAVGFAENLNYVGFWIFKLLAMYAAVGVSIFISALWEEWTVWRLSARPAEERTFFTPVLRANLYTMLVVMAYGAILIWPQRMRSGDHLVKREIPVQRFRSSGIQSVPRPSGVMSNTFQSGHTTSSGLGS